MWLFIDKLRPFRPIYLPVESDDLTKRYSHPQFSRVGRIWLHVKSFLVPGLWIVLGVVFGLQWARISDACMRTQLGFVPFLADNPHAFETQKTYFDARLHHPTKYGAEPSPEVDRLWLDLAVDYRTVYISEEEGLKAGLQGSVLVNRTYKDGSTGMDYFATVDVFHQLHCLDLLRKALHPNFPYYAAMGEPMFEDNDLYQLQTHLGHCVDILRQGLTCKPEYSLLGYVYVEGEKLPVPNFPATVHQCRDFGLLQEWTRNRAVTKMELADMVDRHDERVVIVPEVP